MRYVIVCGSRSFPRSKIGLIEAELGKFEPGTVVVHGGNGYFAGGVCLCGADMLADEVWLGMGGRCVRMPAQWGLYGRRAGPLRNESMYLTYPIGLVLAFWDGKSRGTADCLRRGRSRRIDCRVIEYL